MEKVELYRQVFLSYKELCATGKQDSSFSAYCRNHGVDHTQMRVVLKNEFQNIRSLPGYIRMGCMGLRCMEVYENFKLLCSEGRQPGTLTDYCKSQGITYEQLKGYMKRHHIKAAGLPGYKGPFRIGGGKCEEVPFENIIFEEAGFLPAQDCAITVKVDGHVEVCFPADTDIDIVAKFIRKMGKEARHVGS